MGTIERDNERLLTVIGALGAARTRDKTKVAVVTVGTTHFDGLMQSVVGQGVAYGSPLWALWHVHGVRHLILQIGATGHGQPDVPVLGRLWVGQTGSEDADYITAQRATTTSSTGHGATGTTTTTEAATDAATVAQAAAAMWTPTALQLTNDIHVATSDATAFFQGNVPAHEDAASDKAWLWHVRNDGGGAEASVGPAADAPPASLTVLRLTTHFPALLAVTDVVVGHCGAGTLRECADAFIPTVAVVNDALHDNHQQELAAYLLQQRHILAATPTDLGHALTNGVAYADALVLVQRVGLSLDKTAWQKDQYFKLSDAIPWARPNADRFRDAVEAIHEEQGHRYGRIQPIPA